MNWLQGSRENASQNRWVGRRDTDKADRLTAITEPDKHTAYTLDGMGNRVEVKEGSTALNAQRKYTAEFNARNQITEQKHYADNTVTATTAFHYDPNGNLIRQSTGGVDTQWRYDVVDRLIETTPPTGPPTQYKYGPSDVRIAKVRNGEEVRYHYDGERITLETNTLGSPQRHYAYSAAGLLNTTILGTTPQYRSSHLDAMGSPVLLTGSDGCVINRTRFDAWGIEHSLFGTRDQAIAFQGYWSGIELEETGALLSAARLYIPSLGIFAERDPVEGTSVEPITFNPYLLGRGNPNYWSDPDGRHSLALTLFRIGAEVGRRSLAWAGHVIAGAALAYVADAQIDYINQRYQAEFAGYSEANRPAQSFEAKPIGPSIYSTPGEQQNLPSNTAHAYPELSKEIATGILPGRQAEPVAPTVFTTPALREDEKGPNVLILDPPVLDQHVMFSEAGGESTISDQGKTKPYSNPKRRPKYASGQVETVYAAAQDSSGEVRDPNTGELLSWDKTRSRAGQWDMGHLSGQEYRKLWARYQDGEIDLATFLNEYRNPANYRPESVSSNRSHVYEEK